jgi:hypothetical protein
MSTNTLPKACLPVGRDEIIMDDGIKQIRIPKACLPVGRDEIIVAINVISQ